MGEAYAVVKVRGDCQVGIVYGRDGEWGRGRWRGEGNG